MLLAQKRHITSIGILCFWIIMMAVFLHREILAPGIRSDITIYQYKPSVSDDVVILDDWKGIYYNNAKIGFSHTRIDPDGKQSAYHIIHTTHLFLSMLGEKREVVINGDAFVDESFVLQSFHATVISGAHRLDVRGNVHEHALALEILSGDNISRKTIPLETNVYLFNTMDALYSMTEFQVGQDMAIAVFDPLSLTVKHVELTLKNRETVTFRGEKIPVFVVTSTYQGMTTSAWVTENGKVIKEISPFGWTMILEDPEHAVHFEPADLLGSDDILSSAAVPVNISLPEPTSLTYLSLDIRGLPHDMPLVSLPHQIISRTDTDSFYITLTRQNIPSSVDETPNAQDMSPWLTPTTFVQSDHAEIRATAQEITQAALTTQEKITALNNWVFTTLRKTPTISVPSALEVLHAKEGDCNEHTVLFTALARSLGIPTKMYAGLVYYAGKFYYHAWPAVYCGAWIPLDPTLDQIPADITHIQLLEGDIAQQTRLAQVIGKIAITIKEYH